jgi:type IV secretory pathway VirD2 relaxase
MSSNEEREFRLRPRKPPVPKSEKEPRVWAIAFKRIMHYARMSRQGKKARTKTKGAPRTGIQSRFQRCAVRVTYTRNATRGQWGAHGRYLARESATVDTDAKECGFSQAEKGIDIAARLSEWQSAQDQLLWKVILSPEFGDRLDLERLTRETMGRMEQDLGTPLEWVAVVHCNTEHPHVHIAVRGVRSGGQQLQMGRDYIQNGIRAVAEDFCTRQIGYRTEFDAADAERREIQQHRRTSLDRIIARHSGETADAAWLQIDWPPAGNGGNARAMQNRHVSARLAVLGGMGLATSDGGGRWRVRRDFESVLRAMQKTADRQKMLAAHGALMSDERLRIEPVQWRQTPVIEGRVLVHGEDDTAGRNYLMLEGTDGRIHFVPYTAEIERARSQGELRTNSFVRLRRRFIGDAPTIETEDFGRAADLLNNRRHFNEAARKLIKRGIVPVEDGWGGWLGKYQAALHEAAMRVATKEHELSRPKERGRDRDRSPGR